MGESPKEMKVGSCRDGVEPRGDEGGEVQRWGRAQRG